MSRSPPPLVLLADFRLTQVCSSDRVVGFTFPLVLILQSDPSDHWPFPVTQGSAAARSLWRHGDVGHHCAVIPIKVGFDGPRRLPAGLWPCERVYVQKGTASVRRRRRLYSLRNTKPSSSASACADTRFYSAGLAVVVFGLLFFIFLGVIFFFRRSYSTSINIQFVFCEPKNGAFLPKIWTTNIIKARLVRAELAWSSLCGSPSGWPRAGVGCESQMMQKSPLCVTSTCNRQNADLNQNSSDSFQKYELLHH